jgi:nitroreductase
VIDLLKSRRSIRKFKNIKIEQEKIEELFKAALLAPSSRSRKPWEFIQVTDEETLLKLSVARTNGSSSFLGKAPLGIVVIADRELCDVWVEDASIASIIIQLTAHSMGLGSCWIQVRERFHNDTVTSEEYIRKTLNIPENYAVLCMIAVGYPGEEKAAYDESKLSYEKIHKDTF